MSKRKELSNERAQKLCQEFRLLITRDGIINGLNADKIMRFLELWMKVTGKSKYEVPY